MTELAPFVLTVVTLGVTDMRRSVRFYEALGLTRKFKATGDEVAFFDAGGVVLARYPWKLLAEDAALPTEPRPETFRGTTLARNCRADEEVDAVMAHAPTIGATLLKAAHPTSYDGYSGCFADPNGHGKRFARRVLDSRTAAGLFCRSSSAARVV